MSDNVHQPRHYTAGSIETIDYIADNLGPELFRAYCIGNVIKYVSRYRHKNGVEDLKKASVYLCWAINGNPAVKLTAAKPVPRPEMDDEEEPPLRACANGHCGLD